MCSEGDMVSCSSSNLKRYGKEASSLREDNEACHRPLHFLSQMMLNNENESAPSSRQPRPPTASAMVLLGDRMAL